VSIAEATTPPDASAPPVRTRAVIIGTGFAGLGMAIALQRQGVDFVIVEKADDVGGTWRDNTYPGCACDVPSHLYSFSFALNPNWSHIFARQAEIKENMKARAQRFKITPHIRYNHDVEAADWDDEIDRWRIRTSAGELTARVVVAAAGPLSQPS